jgi:hypothetical protein
MYDQLIPYGSSVDYFTTMRRVTAVLLNAAGEADRLDDSARLFLASGVTHCSGGDGPSDIDFLTAPDNGSNKATRRCGCLRSSRHREAPRSRIQCLAKPPIR